MKKITLRNIKKESKNLDMDKIDVGSFWESLFLCGPAITQYCKSIDREMDDMTTFAYSACVGFMDQYDRIMENINVKKQLLDLRKVFVNWYVKLSDAQKECCKKYTIKRYEKLDGKIGGRPGQQLLTKEDRRTMSEMIHSFRDSVRREFKMNEKELLRNPYIYKLYTRITYRKEYNRTKGVVHHDSSTNERCYC